MMRQSIEEERVQNGGGEGERKKKERMFDHAEYTDCRRSEFFTTMMSIS